LLLIRIDLGEKGGGGDGNVRIRIQEGVRERNSGGKTSSSRRRECIVKEESIKQIRKRLGWGSCNIHFGKEWKEGGGGKLWQKKKRVGVRISSGG